MINVLEYDRVIVGNSLIALATAFYKNLPLLALEKPSYYSFDLLSSGERKENLWNHFSFLLSISSLLPFGNKIESVEEDGDRQYVLSKGNRRYELDIGEITRINDPLRLNDDGEEVLEILDWFETKNSKRWSKENHFVGEEPIRELMVCENGVFAAKLEMSEKALEDFPPWLVRMQLDDFLKTEESGLKRAKETRDGRMRHILEKPVHLGRELRRAPPEDEESIIRELKRRKS